MIIEKILSKIEKSENANDLKDGLILGLSLGLIWGLIFGLIVGLFFGLIWGLIVGLFFGLSLGLIWGLIFGLIVGLGYCINFFAFLGLASLITHYPSFIPIWLLIIAGLIIAEIFYWLDNSKPNKKQNTFWFSAMKKGEAILESTAVLGYLNLGRLAMQKLGIINWSDVLKWTGYIGAGIIALGIAVGIIYLWIKVNERKYKK